MKTQTLSASLEDFLTEADSWLSKTEAPLVAALRIMAMTLDAQVADPDSDITPSLMSQYTMTLARLYKLQPPTPPAKSKLEALLEAAASDD